MAKSPDYTTGYSKGYAIGFQDGKREVNEGLVLALKTLMENSYDGPLHDSYRDQAVAAIAKARQAKVATTDTNKA